MIASFLNCRDMANIRLISKLVDKSILNNITNVFMTESANDLIA
jgi:hypothetical protein